MTSTITSGRGFVLINDPKLLAHNSVVVLTPLDDHVDLHFSAWRAQQQGIFALHGDYHAKNQCGPIFAAAIGDETM
jgi:hypothetical protein